MSNKLITVRKGYPKHKFKEGGLTWNSLALLDKFNNPWNYADDLDTTQLYMNSTGNNWFNISKKDNMFSKGNMAGGLGTMMNTSMGKGIAGAVGGIGNKVAYSALSGGLSSGAGKAVADVGNTIGGALSKIPGVGTLAGPAVQIFSGAVGGGINAAIGKKVDAEKKASNNAGDAKLANLQYSNSLDNIGPMLSVVNVLKDTKYGFLKQGQEEEEFKDRQRMRLELELMAFRNQKNNANVLLNDNLSNDLANLSAYGGPLDMKRMYEDGGTKGSAVKKVLRVIKDALDVPIHAIFGNPGRRRAYSGGRYAGAGASGHWNSPEYIYRDIYAPDTLLVPSVETFNDAFARARRNGLSTFDFNGRTYTTEMSDNPNWKEAGDRRLSDVVVPVITKGDTITHISNEPREDVYHPGINMITNSYPEERAFGGYLDTLEVSGPIEYAFINDRLHKKNDSNMNNLFAGVPNNVFNIGGVLQTQGGNFTDGVTHIDVGGTHEENPNEGVQLGVDDQGVPNLVEEGEVIYNDYVFSNRLTVPDYKKQYKNKKEAPYEAQVLWSYSGKTFADTAKNIEKATGANERTADKIAIDGMESMLRVAAGVLEKEREKERLKEMQKAIDNMSPEEFAAMLQQREQLLAEQEQQQAMQLQQMELQQAAEQQLMELEAAMQQQLMEQLPTEELLAIMQQQQAAQELIAQLLAMLERYPLAANGGKLFKGGGELERDRKYMSELFNLIGVSTVPQFKLWAKDNNVALDNSFWDDVDKALKEDKPVGWENILLTKGFKEAIAKDNFALQHALGQGYNLGIDPILDNSKARIQSINRGNWKTTNGKGWRGSEDLAFKLATDGLSDAEIDALTTEQLAERMKNTEAYKNTSKWLENADNALLYLNTLYNDPDTPQDAKDYAALFIKNGKWKDGFNYNYATVFGSNGKGVRETNPGTYWHSVEQANRGNIKKNLLYDRDKNDWYEVYGDIGKDWNLKGTYKWADANNDNEYNYYMAPGIEFHAVEGDEDYLPTDKAKWQGVGDETRRVALPNRDTVVYHSALPTDAGGVVGNGVEGVGDMGVKGAGASTVNDPFPKAPTWPYLAGIGLLLGSLGYNLLTPTDYSNADALIGAAKSAGNFMPVRYRPRGNFLVYKPDDPWFYTSPIMADSRATDLRLSNTSGGNEASLRAALIANGYNTTTSLGKATRLALEHNDEKNYKYTLANNDLGKTWSEGFLKADMANQEAALQAAKTNTSLLQSGYTMRQAAADAKANAISAGISGIGSLLYNMADTNYKNKVLGWGIKHNAEGPIVGYGRERYDRANGGKLKKKKKGLGF